MEVLKEIPISNVVDDEVLLWELKRLSDRLLEAKEILSHSTISNELRLKLVGNNIKNSNKLKQITKQLTGEIKEPVEDKPIKETFENSFKKRVELDRKLKDNKMLEELIDSATILIQKNNVMRSTLSFNDATGPFLTKASKAEDNLIKILDKLYE